MSKNVVKIVKQFLLTWFLLYKKQKLKNTPQNLLHAFLYFRRASNQVTVGLFTLLIPNKIIEFCVCKISQHAVRYANPSRISQIPNLPQNSLIHLLSFPVEPPAVLSKILERAFYVSQKHFAVFVAFLLVVVDYLNAWKVQCL